jgi:hypothetical protein
VHTDERTCVFVGNDRRDTSDSDHRPQSTS